MRCGGQEWRRPTRNCAEKQAEDKIVSALDVSALRSSSPSLTESRAKRRRSTFSLSLPWQLRDRNVETAGTANLTSNCSSLSISGQSFAKRFANLFPELATTSKCGSFQCSSSLKTPPLTPPDHSLQSEQSARRYTQALMLAVSSGASASAGGHDCSCSCLVHEYACALEWDVAAWQGTLFITTTHVCFYGVRSEEAFRILVGYKNVFSVSRLGHDSIRIIGTSDARADRNLIDEARAHSEENFKDCSEFVFTGFASQDQVVADIVEQRMMHGQDVDADVSEPTFSQNPCSNGCEYAFCGGSQILKAPAGFCTGCDKRGPSCAQPSPLNARSSTTDVEKARAETRSFADLEGVLHWEDNAPSSRSGSSISLSSSNSQEQFAATARSYRKSAGAVQSSGRSPETEEDIASDTAYAGPLNVQQHSGGISAPIPIQCSAASASMRGPKLKAPTPPPSLLSPPLTTTKVSRSSPMVRGAARPGAPQEPSIGPRKGPHHDGIEEVESEEEVSIATSSSPSQRSSIHGSTIQGSPQPDAGAQTLTQAQRLTMSTTESFTTIAPPLAPCGCSRHYKYPILSTIIPTSLEKCFEVLFSARGAGQGDRLVSETLRSVNGSHNIKITPWTRRQAENVDNKNSWEGKVRTLEHSSILKAHHSKNARTDCRETQRVLEYCPHTIRVLSGVWPNLSGGHLIALLSQICFTWDSPGYTRIKCFTEVEYTRAPSWVSAYEADLLEPIDRFYKELIRRLVESIDKRDATHGWSITTPTTSNSPAAALPVIQQKPFLAKASSTITSPTCNTKSFSLQDLPDSSPALSLLSQQLRRNPPAQSKKSRVSMESARPTAVSVVEPSASHAMTVPTTRRNKTAALIIQAMFPVPVSPIRNQPLVQEQAASKDHSRAGDLVAKSDATAVVFWTELLKKGMSLLGTATNRTRAVPIAGQLITSGSEAASKDHVSKSISTLSNGSTQVGDRSNGEIVGEETADPRLSSAAPSYHPSVCIARSSARQDLEKHTAGSASSYKIPRVILVFFTVGMVISAMNVWHLFSAVSSVVDMLQQSQSSISFNDGAYEQHLSRIQRDMLQQHHSHETLAPIQQQKELLRAEIAELMLMLASARRRSEQDHGAILHSDIMI
ncbi:unnamed protein product [Mortierella alpina]